MNQFKNDILKYLVSLLSVVCDNEFQERVWVKGKGPECDSFDEFICEFLPLARDILKNETAYLLTKEQEDYLYNLFLRVEGFSDGIPESYSDQKIINDPEWGRIQELSRSVLEAFKDHPYLKGK